MPAVELLRKGCDPYSGTPLDTRPRRLCKRDVGSRFWSGDGRPDDNLVWFSDGLGLDNGTFSLVVSTTNAMAHLDACEDDPFGHGLCIG